MRFVLFADLHLDTAFAWASPEAARMRRRNLRETLRNILALADEVDADAILGAGDLYEHDRFTPDTAAFLTDTLNSTHRPVLVAPGNHDWYGPRSLYAQADWGSNVTVFTGSELAAHTVTDGLTVWGAAHRAPAGTAGFLDDFAIDRGGVNLGLFHGSERSGLAFETESKDPHAPFQAARIQAAGLDHALVGHFHRPAAGDRHTYPGNPDPLTFGEDGERGAVVVDVGEDGSVERTWYDVAVSAVHDVTVDVTGAVSIQDVRDHVEDHIGGLKGCARITLKGEVQPSLDLQLDAVTSLPCELEAMVVRTRGLHVGYDLDEIAAQQTIRGQFVRDVCDSDDLDDDQRHRVIVTGLRALDGREDLAPQSEDAVARYGEPA